MSEDLIKRSDAAEVVYKALRTPPLKGVLTDTMSLAIALVRDVPSADRPSATEIMNAYHEGVRKGIAEAYEAYGADRPQGEWIPCKEKRPKNDDWKIITICDESGDRPYIYSDFGWYFDRAECWIVDAEQRNDVIAWMPLPEPYGERKGE